METKICTKCNLEKDKIEFRKDSSKKDGLRTQCKKCNKKIDQRYYKNNKEKAILASIKWQQENSDKVKEANLLRNITNPDKERLRKLNWAQNNPEKIKESQKKYRLNNKEKIKEYKKTIKHSLAYRQTLHNALRRLGQKKEGHSIEILGYSILDFKNHIESLFTEGMSWDNYGEWHIDHIQRVSEFHTNTQINIVNALSNLRPLWATTRVINGIIYEGNLNRG